MDLKAFDDTFAEVVQCLTTDDGNEEIKIALNWFKQILEYNVPFGKKTRGLTVIKSFQAFAPTDQLTDHNRHLACILGWCVEMLQAFFLIADDIMDQSETRRNKQCWYKRKDVGLIAINDAFSLESDIYIVLRKYFCKKPYYIDLVELFLQATRHTVTGQTLDLIVSSNEHAEFTLFTPAHYETIVKFKTAFYSFYLPVVAGMYMAGVSDEKILEQIKPVLLKLGELFQIQDDYIDCFGDPSITGKIGTDIDERKCTWLIVTALKEATENQKAILLENFKNPSKDQMVRDKVKAIYEELELPKLYKDYEKKSHSQIVELINELPKTLPTSVFLELLEKIYQREK